MSAGRSGQPGLAGSGDSGHGVGPLTSPWIWPALVLVAALVGGWGSVDAPQVYARLDKPAWAPPAAVFGPAWTVLYALMALAALWVARLQDVTRHRALAVFAAQLVANALWSWCFFAWRDAGLALVVLGLMWLLLLASVRLFWRLRRGAGALLLPVLAWVSFAGALNASVLLRNPAVLG